MQVVVDGRRRVAAGAGGDRRLQAALAGATASSRPRRATTGTGGDSQSSRRPSSATPQRRGDRGRAAAALRRRPAQRSRAPAREACVTGETAEYVDYFDGRPRPGCRSCSPSCCGLSFLLLTRRLPLDRRPARGDRDEPALGRRGLRPARARLPARASATSCSASSRSTHRGLGAALPVHRALRALDGLPRVPAEPHPRALRPDGRQRRRRSVRRRRRPRG